MILVPEIPGIVHGGKPRASGDDPNIAALENCERV